MSKDHRYRPNAAALILDKKGRLLICERINATGSWQFPQGGVDDGESVKKAMKREVREEVGFKKCQYKILRKKGGYQYLYPAKTMKRKLTFHGYHGQEQTYFLIQMNESEPVPDLTGPPVEFGDYRWIQPEDFQLSWVPDFKKETYRQVFADFFEIVI